MILEPFAGPGGTSTGLALTGRTDTVGVELDPDACSTAAAAGHARVRADVATFPLHHLAGRVEGLAISPPCTPWSRAGKREVTTRPTASRRAPALSATRREK